MSLTFHTEFDVIDYTGGKETKVGHYKQEVSDTSAPIVTSTPDRWGVEKSIKDGYPKYLLTRDDLLQRRSGIKHRNLPGFMASQNTFNVSLLQ